MKKTFFITVLVFICSMSFSFAQTDALVWQTDLLKAQGLSEKEGRPIFAFFTGSDWCGWCNKLQKDVFAKPEFIAWAKKNVILLELDFPRRKQLPPELIQQNTSLQQTFGVQGYPTIWMFTMTKDEAAKKYNISPLGSLGYPRGAEPGQEQTKFLSEANNILTKSKLK